MILSVVATILSMLNLRLLFLLLILINGAAHAATTIADAFVTPGPGGTLAANNYGGAGALAISGSGNSKGEFGSLLRFDISDDLAAFDSTYGASGWTITGVSLQLTTSTANNALFNTSSAGQFVINWIATDSWTEGSGNPNTPSVTGVNWLDLSGLLSGAESQGAFAFASVLDGVTDTYTFAPSGGLLNDIFTDSTLSFALTAGEANMSAVFNSRNFGTAARRPVLTLTAAAVPEPSRLAFALLGASVCWMRRRRA